MRIKPKYFIILGSILFTLSIAQSTIAAVGNPAEGARTFDSICSSCHGDKGVTEIPGIPIFSKGERMSKTDEQLKKSIKNGVNNPNNPAGMTMPPHGGGPELNDKQLSDVIAYIRTLKKQ